MAKKRDNMEVSLTDTVFRLFLACLFGAGLGWEREKKGRSAGLRTHMLVCMGAALIMLISFHIQATMREVKAVDTIRIAAGVVTGIGFLGAGTIIKTPENAKGLTTAASIWISSAIGLAIGSGYLAGAGIAMVFSVSVLYLLKKVEG
ncbi:MAG: hypothetical protein GF408_00850 [Candidatus Omnitrophica bacterium]|nr:hypothetical protein [Candidatus Omnitrophota bacterium]